MTERTRYIVSQALRLHLGIWFTDQELDHFMEYLSSQGLGIEETKG